MNGKIYCYFNRKKFETEGVEKYYIGQTVKSIKARAGKNGLQYQTNPNSKIARAIKKWGWESFEVTILEEGIESIEELNKMEMYYIGLYDSYNNGYNSTLGGEGQLGRKASPETIEKLKKSHVGQKPWNKGVPATEEAKKKMSEAKKKLTGENHPKYGTHISEEHKEKLRQNAKINPNYGMKGKNQSKETIEKIRNGNKDRWKQVYCDELSMCFKNVTSASEYVSKLCGIKSAPSNIIACCNGKRKSYGSINKDNQKIKLTWKYVNITNND